MKTRTALIASLLAALALPVLAQGSVEDQIKAELRKQVPEAPVDSVRKAPLGNLYEVVIGGDIVYTDEKASTIIMGPMIDVKTKENLTEARLRQVNAIAFDQLDFKNAIKIVRGDGSRKLAIFEDPNCGYCKRFERDLLGVNNVTVYVFLYPILSTNSIEQSKVIWCAKDPGKMWLDHMTKDLATSGEANCSTGPVDQNLAFGKAKRINGTPTIIFENGERVPGVMPIAEVEKHLAMGKNPPPQKTASSK
jgi:thiol:disulfide interchange protein DsbC